VAGLVLELSTLMLRPVKPVKRLSKSFGFGLDDDGDRCLGDASRGEEEGGFKLFMVVVENFARSLASAVLSNPWWKWQGWGFVSAAKPVPSLRYPSVRQCFEPCLE
jgi:hypothetical protein